MAEVEDLDGTHRVGVGVVLRVEGLAPVHRVAGEEHRGGLHHRLRVARVAADGVQLQQLAALVLVRLVPHRLPVVEVHAHRRVQRAGDEQVLEARRGRAGGWWRRSRSGRPRRGHAPRGCACGWTRTRSSSRGRTVRSRSGEGCSSCRGRCRTPTPSCRCRRWSPTSRRGCGAAVRTRRRWRRPCPPRPRLAGESCRSSHASGLPAVRSCVRARWVNPVPNRLRYSRSREPWPTRPDGGDTAVQKDDAL